MRKILIGFLLSVLMVFPIVADDTTCGTGTEPYTELEYIESTGGQWIDTGIVPALTTKTEVGLKMFNVTGGTIIGQNLGTNNMYRLFNYSQRMYFDFGNDGGSGRLQGGNFKTNTYYDFEFGNFYVKNKTTGETLSGIPKTSIQSLPSMRIHSDGVGQYYYLRIYEGDTLVRDFVPVKRNSDGAVGMYDSVSGEFFGNSGTGEFIAGPVVASCLVCGTGYYNSVGNDTSCTVCPTGYNATGDNATDHDEISDCMITCPAGQYVAEPNGECVPVPAGYYAPNKHSVGYGQTSSDVGGILQCPSGKTSDIGAQVCRDICGTGTEPNPDYIPLPDNYTQLEYIESTGTQYIDTRYIPGIGTRFTIKAKAVQPSTKSQCFGGTVNYNKVPLTYFAPLALAGSSHYYYFNSYHSTGISVQQNDILFGSIEAFDDQADISIDLNGKQYNFSEQGVLDTKGLSIFLFSETSGGEPSKIAMYESKIYQNDEIRKDFVPVRRNSDGAIGMYDSVSGEFFGNSGTGEFIAGPVVGGACIVCPINYYNSIGNDTSCVACPSGLVSPMGSVDAGSCGRKTHIGDEIIYLRSVKKTTPSLNFDIDNDGIADFFGNATTQLTTINSTSSHYLHVGDYYIYDDTVTPEK